MVHPAVTELSPRPDRHPWVSQVRAKARLTRWQSTSGPACWWGLGLASFALGLMNGALVISAGVGVVAYRQLAQLSPRQWQALRQQVDRALPRPGSTSQRALVLSLLLTASTYTMTSLWQSTHSLVMALVLTGQTALTFFVVGLLLRSTRSSTDPSRPPSLGLPQGHDSLVQPRPEPDQTVASFERLLGDLTQADPLKRLIAVRQLSRLVGEAPADQAYGDGATVTLQSHTMDCFHVMLAHEPEPIVRSAVRQALTLLRASPPLPAGASPLGSVQPLAPDPKAAVSPRQGRRLAAEYVEYLEV